MERNASGPPPPEAALSREERREEKRKQQMIKARIVNEKVHAINGRRQALSYATIFYFLALHKIESKLFAATPLLVRQALFILFAHQIVAFGVRTKQLMQFKNSTDLKKRQTSEWRKTLEWMADISKALARALDLQPEDRFTSRIIRGLEELVDLTLFPRDVIARRRSRGIMIDATDKQNVVLNPMFAKRLIVNFTEAFRAELDRRLHQEPSSSCTEELLLAPPVPSKAVEPGTAPSRVETPPQSAFDLDRVPTPVAPRSLATLGFKKLSTFTSFSAAALPRTVVEAASTGWGIYMSTAALMSIQAEVCHLSEDTLIIVEDLAERIKHLPTLTAEILSNAEPAVLAESWKSLLHGDSATRPRHDSQATEQHLIPSESGDDAESSSCTDVEGYMQVALVRGDSLLHSASSEICVSPVAVDSSPIPLTAPAVMEQHYDESETWAGVAEVITFPVIVLWNIFFRLLVDGTWNGGIDRVCRDVARNLDLDNQFLLMLLAYAADAVCDALHGVAECEAEVTQNSARDLVVDTTTGEAIAIGTSLASVDPTTLKRLAKKHRSQNVLKGLKIAGMSVGVGALSALTAGLAAPAFAAGFGALGIAGTSGLTAFLGSAGGAASLASLFGASSASLSGWKYSRRLADIRVCGFIKLDSDRSNHSMDAIGGYIHEIIEYKQKSSQLYGVSKSLTHMPLRSGVSMQLTSEGTINPQSTLIRRPLGLHHLSAEYSPGCKRAEPPFRLAIGVSGWLKESVTKDNCDQMAVAGWEFLRDCLGTESYTFQWEPQLLSELGFMMVRLLGENVAYQAATLSIQIALSASAGFIMWPVSFIQYAGQLDNAWLTAKERAQQAGVILAAAICDKAIVGNRPVTLIGCSMGSRVITYCLKELYSRGEFFRVSDVILMGLPDGKGKDDWRKMKMVVSGRLINVYNSSDFILIFLYRWMEWGVSVAGLSPVEGVPGVENFDASALIQSHYQYEEKLPDILALLKIHSTLVKYI